MEFRFTRDLEAFREDIRSYLEKELTEEFRAREVEEGGWSPSFSRQLGERGYIAFAWPTEYGGKGGSHFEQLVYAEELARADAPTRFHFMASSLVGPSVLLYGSDEQKKDYLPRIARGEISFCQGFSEPNSGSDLASLSVRATREGDSFVINGQKIWTSDAHRADYCWLGARTDPQAPKHKGISTFVVDMSLPGIVVKPLLTMNDHHHFNEVFFNDVVLPADALVGQENHGWYQMTTTLDFERSGAARYVGLRQTVDRLAARLRRTRPAGAEVLRLELADLHVACEVGRLISYRVAYLQSKGEIPNSEASMSKAFGSSLEQRVADFGVRMFGGGGNVWGPSPETHLDVADNYMWSAAATIRGGTNEVQKNIIAGRGLGLPRG